MGDRGKVTRVLLTSGKIYYDLVARKPEGQARRRRDRADRAALPAAAAPAGSHAGRLPERHGVLLGAGGAGQPGCVADVRSGAARAAARQADRDQADLAAGDERAVIGSSKVHAVETQEILDEAFG